jgi:hypothetical protein
MKKVKWFFWRRYNLLMNHLPNWLGDWYERHAPMWWVDFVLDSQMSCRPEDDDDE